MSDASKAYSYLCENIPKWLETIDELQKKTSAERQDEIAKIAVPVSPAVKKSGSSETIRDDAEKNGHRVAIEVTSAPQADDTTSSALQRQHQVLLAKRKRKTASLLSGHMSGPSKYRSRGLVIVYYDSEVQKGFESLVRSIGAGRNLLRKGKMAARIESLGALEQDSEGEDGDYDNPVLAKIGYRPRLGMSPYRTTRARAGFDSLTDPAPSSDQFDATDKTLEKAQSLCERGAHQFLRDGDCTDELEGCKQSFVEALELAKPEAVRYKVRDEQNKRRQEQREREQKEKEREKERERERKKERDEEHPRNPILSPADSNGLLEVDDNTDDEEELNLAALRPIRMTSRMTSRMTARV